MRRTSLEVRARLQHPLLAVVERTVCTPRSTALQTASDLGLVILCPVVFSEVLAHPTASESRIQQFFLETGIQVDYRSTDAFWRTAGLAYAQYAARRRNSSCDQPRRMVADYLIGAHALLNADSLMTLDPSTYQRDFPELRLITP